jgi:hypothetical protein
LRSPFTSLAAGAGRERTLDLLPPGLGEMAKIVHDPAAAAGLAWEREAASGERLDERLIADILDPDLLPLVQFALDRLYEQLETREGAPTLTFAAYRALGALDGAIYTAAEQAFATLGAAEQAALPRLLRALVATSADAEALTLAPRPRATAAHDAAAERLIAALVDARILVAGDDSAHAPTLALAHQRVAKAWRRADTIIEGNRGLMRARDAAEAARMRWEAEGRRPDLLLPAGLRLSEAADVAARLGEELPQATQDFIAASGRAARRRERLAQAAAVAFACLFVAAGAAALLADKRGREAAEQRDRAEKNLALATRTADGLVFDLAQKFRDIGFPSALRAEILGGRASFRSNWRKAAAPATSCDGAEPLH